jgi:IMP dehydrogenase
MQVSQSIPTVASELGHKRAEPAERDGRASGNMQAESSDAPSGGTMDEGLITVADVMVSTVVSVAAEDTVATAVAVVREHGLSAVPVVDDGRVVGLVTPVQLLREPPYRNIAEVMTSVAAPATPDLSLLQASALLSQQNIEILPVVEDGRLVGQISLVAILRAHGQQTDPLTGLPWATALRAWSSAALARGHEISILFIDLDNFGIVNKALGHVVGDDILRSITYLLGSIIAPSTDLLCRYGGDEFAIASTRREDEARALAERIQETVVLPVEIGGISRRVTVSVGFSGGRRVEGRAPAHIAATVEDLLTLASRASTAAKEAAQSQARRSDWGQDGPTQAGGGGSHSQDAPPGGDPAEPRGAHAAGSPATITQTRESVLAIADGGEAVAADDGQMILTPRRAETRLRLVEVAVNSGPAGCRATVILGLGERERIGHASGHVHGRGELFVVAEATLAAIGRAIGQEHTYIVEELTDIPSDSGKLVMTVLTNESSSSRRFVGGARAADVPHAVAKAILDALNRVLARSLAEILVRDASL